MKPIQIGALIVSAIAAFFVSVGLGTAVNVLSGIPLLGGLINGVFTAAILTIGLLLVRKWFSATLMWFVFGLLAVPTFTLGPPGWYKLGIALVAGFLWDSIYQLGRRSRMGLYIGGVLGALSIILLMLVCLRMIATEEMVRIYHRYVSAIWGILIINLIVTTVGIYCGDKLFTKRLSQLEPFKNILRHGL